jgi:transcription initiation factor TFIIB
MLYNYRERLKVRNEEPLKSSERSNIGKCCNNPSFEKKAGEIVCINCGMVIGTNLVGNERRAYTTEEIEKRRRTEPRWREFGPRTVLSNPKIDSKGKTLGAKCKTLFSRLSKIQNSLVSSIERNFWEAKPKLKMLCSKLNIPEYIKETAWRIYTIVAKKRLTMGRSIDGFIGASLYCAIRIHKFPRLLEGICDVSMTPRRKVHKSLGIIVREVLPIMGLKYNPIRAEQLVFKFCNDLGLPMKVQKEALRLLINASRNGLFRAGKDPKGLAGSVIYMAARKTENHKTQTEVAEQAHCTEVTLRSRIKEIENTLKL